MSQLEWSEPADVRSEMASAVSGLPTGTVTLLLADVEGSTRLWETQPDEMTAAIARLDTTLSGLVAAHGGVRPVEQGEGDSFVVAFARASDAVACALALQRAPLAPIRLRIGINTGEIQLRDEDNYIGPTINRTARIRDLGHGGQTLLTGATEAMVVDHLPADAWLNDLGAHALRDLQRPERVVQLCHPDIRNEFPPLRAAEPVSAARLPAQLTSFVGRQAQIAEVCTLLGENRLVTLTGAGGSGKTRLAIRVAGEWGDDVGYVDLAPITDSELVPVAAIRALGLPDQPGRTGTITLLRFIADRPMLLLLDNCEHLLDASGELIATLLDACLRLTVLTTSREPIGLDGEVTWRVPSLSLTDEAVELFTDRARRVRPGFTAVTDEDAATVMEICKRLDGMPLAIELAAARVRSLSLTEILVGLHDRFRLLTGGSRRAVRRQQSLGASVDWSHALLTETERILFRRLAAFMGGFSLAAAQEVCSGDGLQRHQILDQLALLVDKSLVVAETTSGATRYRLLETIRQYALEKLGDSGEADTVRDRHRDHFTTMALAFDAVTPADYAPMLAQAELEIDNLRAAFAWSVEQSQLDMALELVCALQPLWQLRGRPQEGLTWFDTAFAEVDGRAVEIDAAVRARALADNAVLRSLTASISGIPQAEEALAIARELDDRALIARALTACIGAAAFDVEAGRPYAAEAIEVARELGDKWRLSQILAWQAYRAGLTGHPVTMAVAGEEGHALADEVGDWFISRMCRFWGRAIGRFERGAVGEAAVLLRELLAEADASADMFHAFICRVGLGNAMLLMGRYDEARVFAQQAVDAAPELGPFLALWAYAPLARVALMQGDIEAAAAANDVVLQQIAAQPEVVIANVMPMVEFAFVQADLSMARARADEAVSAMTGWHRASALTTRARVALAQGEFNQAETDAHDALHSAGEIEGFQVVPDALESLVEVGCAAGNHLDAARLAGAASSIRQAQGGTARLRIYDPPYEAALVSIREALGDDEFDTAWAEGAALTLEEAVGYAQRGRGARNRPPTGWESLTPTELDVVRLVSEGLSNKDIAARLFISHRTVQTHLTHVYSKLAVTSRVALAQEAARRG